MKKNDFILFVFTMVVLLFSGCKRNFGIPVDADTNSKLFSQFEGWWIAPLFDDYVCYSSLEEAREAAETIDYNKTRTGRLYRYYLSDEEQRLDCYSYSSYDLFKEFQWGNTYYVRFTKDKGGFVNVAEHPTSIGRTSEIRADYIAEITDNYFITGKPGAYSVIKRVTDPIAMINSAYKTVNSLAGSHVLILNKKTIRDQGAVVSEKVYEDTYPSISVEANFFERNVTGDGIAVPQSFGLYFSLGSYIQSNGFSEEHNGKYFSFGIGYCYFQIGNLYVTMLSNNDIIPYSRCKIISLDESSLVLLCEKPETTELTELVFSVVK